MYDLHLLLEVHLLRQLCGDRRLRHVDVGFLLLLAVLLLHHHSQAADLLLLRLGEVFRLLRVVLLHPEVVHLLHPVRSLFVQVEDRHLLADGAHHYLQQN